GRQSDLALVLQTKSVEVYSNSLFHGIVSMTVPGDASPVPVFSTSSNSGPLAAGATVTAGYAPASAFSLTVNGQAVPRSIDQFWAPTFQVAAQGTGGQGDLVLHRLPLNGLLALFTLLLWALMWLGFGWIHRLEWIFTGRPKSAKARHARHDHE
ncbi:MAG TPA: hypothetical protein VIJ99_08130, partial [Acidimicrobiales bacterium]